jgi:hypothetical protein
MTDKLIIQGIDLLQANTWDTTISPSGYTVRKHKTCAVLAAAVRHPASLRTNILRFQGLMPSTYRRFAEIPMLWKGLHSTTGEYLLCNVTFFGTSGFVRRLSEDEKLDLVAAQIREIQYA